jgi:hypothetical protein
LAGLKKFPAKTYDNEIIICLLNVTSARKSFIAENMTFSEEDLVSSLLILAG